MGLINLLTNPQNFKFYNGGQGYTGDGSKPNLKNLPYGNDRIYNGNSKQPYITYSIDNGSAQIRLSGTPFPSISGIGPNLSTNIPNGLTNLSNWNNDFILRGGTRAFTDAAIDVIRLTKWFTSSTSPNGLFFVGKQQLLSRTAVRTQTSNVSGGRILNEGIYSPLNTLLQAGVNGIGIHLNKQGLNPFQDTGVSATNNQSLYGVRVKPNQNDLSGSMANNRLVKLYTLISGSTPGKLDGFFLNDGNILSYSGGPGSYLGALKTHIRFADQRTGKENIIAKNRPNYFNGTQKKIVEPNYTKTLFSNTAMEKNKGVTGTYYNLTKVFPVTNINLLGTSTDNSNHNVYDPIIKGNTWPKTTPLINSNGTYVYNQLDIINQTPIKGTYNTTQDFRVILRDNKTNQSTLGTTKNATNTGQLAYSLDYDIGAGKTIENRVNLGDPGNRSGKSYANYNNGVLDLTSDTITSVYPVQPENSLGTSKNSEGINVSGSNVKQQLGLDKINSLPVYSSQNADTSGITNDLVKFRIAIIDNDTPSFKTFIHFRAFLDSISDSYNAAWNPVQYLGRGENFYNYNGFTRQISLGWTVAAQSKEELIPMYKKLNFLASSLAPDYSPSGYMRGNMVQLTIGGYIFEQPGIITGLTYTMEETTPWEIGIKTNYNTESGTVQGDNSTKELAHIIKVSGFTFIPIHKFRPEVQNPGDQNDIKRFIALADGEGASNNSYGS